MGRQRRSVVSVLAGALAFVALASCAADEDRSSSATVPTESPGDASGGGLTDSPTGEGAPATTAPAGNEPQAPADRKLIIRVTVGVEVDDVAKAVDEVISLARVHGGELSQSSVDLSDPRYAGGEMVFRIPPEQTQAFIEALDPGIGRRTSLQTSQEDVTLQVTDLDARIKTARAGLDRVQALLASAKNLGEVISLESELTERQTALEELLAQKKYLDGLVALSTVTVRLSAAPQETATDADTGVAAAFRRGWSDFVGFLRALVVVLGRTWPFLALLGLIAAVVLPFSRRMAQRNRSAAPPNPPVPGEGPRTN
ncbi:MAG: hypothetical protein RI900_3022 [Actinomycetota bacterium]